MASDELTQAVEAQAQAALCERLDELLAVLPAEEADQIRAELEAAEDAEAERSLAEERATAAQSLTAAERERQDWLVRQMRQGRRLYVAPRAALRAPVRCGARTRPRARGRQERRTVRSSARSGDSGSSEPGGDGEPHGRCADVDLPRGRRCSR